MRMGNLAVAFLIALIVIQPAIPQFFDSASAVPAASRGRAGPPTNGSQWDIIGIFNVTTDIDFSGNITVYTNAQLRITNGARFRILPDPSTHYTVIVKAGGSVQVENRSIFEVDRYRAESGTGFNVLSGSVVRARGVLEAVSSCYINDSSITVTGASGTSSGQPGDQAKLVLNPGGQIKNCDLAVIAGDGFGGENGTGLAGGSGGDATLVMTSHEFSNVRANIRSGRGGNGGTAGSTSLSGGGGGRGGNIILQMNGEILANTVIKAVTGNGGNASAGASPGGMDAGAGGRGGDGGGADFRWTGKAIDISSSNLSIITGNAGHGGDGGVAQSSGKNGGTGGDAGAGGSVTALIDAKSTFTITDSDINLLAGYGPTGGKYGRAMLNGIDGRAGEGGTGGSASCVINLTDAFTATKSSLLVSAGDAGSGGAGSTGAKGGGGGTGMLSFTMGSVNAEPTFYQKYRALVARGGRGGDGGRGQGSGVTPGQPGDGGKGGGARLEILSSIDLKNVDINYTEISCDPGAPGGAIYPAKIGNPGVGEIYFITKSVNIRNCIVTQTMGPVDGNDLWVLESTPIPASTPFNVSDAGVAEVYWKLTCNVKDISGNLVTDGSANVEVKLNDETVTTKRTNSFGRADFILLGARHVANPEETVRIITYVAQAIADDGRFSRPVSVQLTGDRTVDLVLIQKAFLPTVTVDSPNDKITAIIYATNYLRSNGSSEQFIIEGTAADSVFNSEQSISAVEIAIGDDPWKQVNLTMPTFNSYKWTYSWDIYNWAQDHLTRYPLGIIPANIVARSYNHRYYSSEARQNITVYLLKIPPAPPVVMITKPVQSTRENPNSTELPYEKMLPFEARVVSSNGTRVIKWAWCFDDSSEYREDYSSPYTSSTNVSYTQDQNDKYMFVILKVFDNESAKRVDLLAGGVSYNEFKYQFERDGSIIVKLRVHIKPIPPPPPKNPLLPYLPFIALGIVAVAMMAAAAVMYSVRKKRILEKKQKEARESLRVEVADLTCARCGEPVNDATGGCIQCRAQDTLSVVQQAVLRLKDSGINISEAEKVLEDGVDAFDSKSFQEAITKANAAREMATQLENKFTETSTVITGWETKIYGIRADTPEADLTEPETKVYHARLALGRGDHAEAVKYLVGLEPLLEKASKAGMRKGTQELIESTKRMIANIEKRGVILSKKVAAAVEQASFALSQSEYELAQEHCKEAELLVKDTNRVFMKASAALRQSEERVLDAKGTARPVGTTEDLLRQAKEAMAAGGYSSVTEFSTKILAFFGVSAKAPAPKRVDWRKEVAVLEGREGAPGATGLRPAAAPGAKPAAAAAALPPLLEIEVSPEMKEAAEKMLKAAGEAIASARELALDVRDGEELLEKAKDAYKARRYPESTELSKSAKFLMQELAGAVPRPKPRITAPATSAAAVPGATMAAAPASAAAAPASISEPKASIDRAEALIARLAQMGGDVSGLETMVTRAKSARDGGSTIVALQFAKDAINQGDMLMKEYEAARKGFDLAERLLAIAKTRDLDTTDAEFQLRQARNAMAGGAFGRVADTATLVVTILKELDPSLEKEAAAPAPVISAAFAAPRTAIPAAPAVPAPAAPAAASAISAPPAAAAASPGEGVKCPGCARIVKASWKTCPFCGAKITPTEEKPAVTVTAAPSAPPAPKPAVTVTAAPSTPPAPVSPPAVKAAEGPKGVACPKCNTVVKPHWKVCPSCGSALAPTAATPSGPAVRAAPAAPVDTQERCPACGAKVTPGMTVCPLCRTPLVPDAGVLPEPEPPKKVLKFSKPIIEENVPAQKPPQAPAAAAPSATPVIKIPPATPPAAAPAPTRPVIVPAAKAPPAAPAAAPAPTRPVIAPAVAAPITKPPAAAAPSRPVIIPPAKAPMAAPTAAEPPAKVDAGKTPVVKVLKKKIVVKKKDEEE
jgi:hypothetical protein